jgi:hypothetical protein
MRLTASPSRLWLLCAALVPAMAASCSSSSSPSSPVDGGSDVVTQPVEAGEAASPGLDSSAPGDASDAGVADAPVEAYVVPGTNFAFRHYYLGDTDRTGTASATAWMQFGMNLDGLTTTAASIDVCTLAAGSSKQVQVDGDNGIDNSWGANIMPIFETLDSTFSQTYNQAVSAGTFTNMIDLLGLAADAGPSGPVAGWGFEGASFPGTPTWTTSDNWPVYPDWLRDGGLASGSKIAFPGGSLDAGVWTSGAPTDFPILISFGLQSAEVVIHHASVAFSQATPSTTSGGVVGGVLNTVEMLGSLQATASWGDMSLACGSAWQSIAAQIVQTQDILLDGTNVAGQPCDGISIGIGFDGVQIGPVQTVTQAHGSLPNLCEAGGD